MVEERIEWYVSRDGTQLGPFSRTKLEELRLAGQLSHTDLLWRQGWADWVPAENLLDGARQSSAPQSNTVQATPVAKGRSHVRRAKRGRRIPMVVLVVTGLIGALGGGLLSNWQYFFPPPSIAEVENCDKSLNAGKQAGSYSGIYAGVIWDGAGETAVQLKLVRSGNTVQGSYLRHGVCGTIFGELIDGKMRFLWKWAGNSGRGTAEQEGTLLIAISGFGKEAEGGGTLVFYQRNAK